MLKFLNSISNAASLTGSRAICDPIPTGSDIDFIVWGSGFTSAALITAGFMKESPDSYDCAYFTSFRKGDVNVILTFSDIFYCKFTDATRLAKALNLQYKQDRRMLFQAILYEKFPNG